MSTDIIVTTCVLVKIEGEAKIGTAHYKFANYCKIAKVSHMQNIVALRYLVTIIISFNAAKPKI